MRTVRIVAVMFLAIIACSTERTGTSSGKIIASQSATTLLHTLQAKFVLKYEAPRTPDQLLKSVPNPATAAILQPSDVMAVEQTDDRLSATFNGGKASATVTLPDRATGSIELAADASKIRATLSGATAVAAELADGYLIYDGAAPGGGHLLHRVTREGVEDFVTFASAPQVAAVEYSLQLVSGIAGLRLVAGTLEMLDQAGAPRLRVRSPYLVGDDGKAVAASLAVTGCAVDSDPSAPWGRSVTAPGASTCTITVSWNNGDVTYPAILDPSWSTTASMSEARANHTQTLLDTGNILVAGGVSAAPSQPGAELYNPSTSTWATTGTPQTKRTDHAAAKLANGKVLIAGGTNPAAGNLSSAELYDPAAGTWSFTGSLGTSRRNFAMHLLSGGKVLAAGGFGAAGVTNSSAELYNPTATTWSGTGTMASSRASFGSSMFDSAHVLVTGGYNGSYLTAAEVYSETATTWSSAGSMTDARSNHSQATIAYFGKTIVVGGINTGSIALATTQLYDPGSNTWNTTPSLATGRANLTATTLYDSRVLFCGGQTVTGAYTNTAELYTNVPSGMATTASLSAARGAHASTALAAPSTKILTSGGYDGTIYSSVAELFDPTGGDTIASADGSDSAAPTRLTARWDNPDLTGTLAIGTTVAATLTNFAPTVERAYIDLVAIGQSRNLIVTRSSYAPRTAQRLGSAPSPRG